MRVNVRGKSGTAGPERPSQRSARPSQPAGADPVVADEARQAVQLIRHDLEEALRRHAAERTLWEDRLRIREEELKSLRRTFAEKELDLRGQADRSALEARGLGESLEQARSRAQEAARVDAERLRLKDEEIRAAAGALTRREAEYQVALRERIAEAETLREKARAALALADERLSARSAEVTALTRLYEARVQDLTERLRERERVAVDLKAELAAAEHRVGQKLEAQAGDWANEKARLQREAEFLGGLRDRLEEEMRRSSRSDAEVVRAQAELRAAEDRLVALRFSHERALELKDSERIALKSSYEDRLARMHTQVAAAQESVQSERDRSAALAGQLREMKAILSRPEESVRSEVAALQESLRATQAEREGLDARHSQALAERGVEAEALREQIAKLQASIQDQMQAVNARDRVLQELRSQVRELERREADSRRELDEARRASAEPPEEMRLELSRLRKQVGEKDEEIKALQEHVEQREGEYESRLNVQALELTRLGERIIHEERSGGEERAKLRERSAQLGELTHLLEGYAAAFSGRLKTGLGILRGLAQVIAGFAGGLGSTRLDGMRAMLQLARHRRDVEGHLAAFMKQVDRLAAESDQFIWIASPLAFELAPVPVGPFLTRLSGTITATCRARGVEFASAFDEALPTVRMEPHVTEEVLGALVQNALDAMVKGGTLTLRAESDGIRVAIRVEDTGPGIPADRLEQILRPFSETTSGRAGTSLARARRLMLLQGGRLDLVSRPGHGTAVSLIFPLPAA